MDPDFSWIYLIFFLIIPLARIIPRILRKKMDKNPSQTIQEERFQSTFEEQPRKIQREFSKPQTKNMLVLGEVNKGTKTFEKILKNTGLNGKELDTILEDLEKNNMIKVQQKQGLLGTKIELYPTDKGFKEYYS
ncbi:MAG: hypothetical protein OER82_10535 [Nitrosopumilus sp.]|nr:hypothetical protein [Nitrosopumilus sp.]